MLNEEEKIINTLSTLKELNKTISERLKTVKSKRNKEVKEPENKITQKEIIKKTGLSKDIISRAFNGKGVSIPTALALCKYLGISTDYLFGVSEYENTEQCEKQHTLNTIKKHISIKTANNIQSTKSVYIGKALNDYLEVIDEHEHIKAMSPELKKQWLEESEEEFLRVIDKVPEEFEQYEAL